MRLGRSERLGIAISKFPQKSVTIRNMHLKNFLELLQQCFRYTDGTAFTNMLRHPPTLILYQELARGYVPLGKLKMIDDRLAIHGPDPE